ncbi:MAG: hypothetical protein Kow0031_08020 [Anaerolineae bacterium]
MTDKNTLLKQIEATEQRLRQLEAQADPRGVDETPVAITSEIEKQRQQLARLALRRVEN